MLLEDQLIVIGEFIIGIDVQVHFWRSDQETWSFLKPRAVIDDNIQSINFEIMNLFPSFAVNEILELVSLQPKN